MFWVNAENNSVRSCQILSQTFAFLNPAPKCILCCPASHSTPSRSCGRKLPWHHAMKCKSWKKRAGAPTRLSRLYSFGAMPHNAPTLWDRLLAGPLTETTSGASLSEEETSMVSMDAEEAPTTQLLRNFKSRQGSRCAHTHVLASNTTNKMHMCETERLTQHFKIRCKHIQWAPFLYCILLLLRGNAQITSAFIP